MALIPKIEVRGVTKIFADQQHQKRTVAVKEFDLVLCENEIVCLVGTSGCGKSTVLRLIAGFEPVTNGTITLDGQRVTRPGPDRGVVFQEAALFPWQTTFDNVLCGPRSRGLDKHEYHRRAQRYLEAFGLAGFEKHYPHQLSGGMKQRVAIARVLINEPRVLLMDEPFGALDAQTRTFMQEWLLELWQETAQTILFVTHDVDEAIFLADRIYVMTSRPGHVKREIKVDLPRPRNYLTFTSWHFLDLKRTIVELIRDEWNRQKDGHNHEPSHAPITYG